MTIAEAAQTVLRDTGRAMHVNDIYEEIIRRNLYHFGAKSPKSVLSQTIREKSTANPKAKTVLFRMVSPGTCELFS